MWAKARTFVLVTLVTVLIWVWADAETQRDDLLSPAAASPAQGGEAECTVERLPLFIAQPASVVGAPAKVSLHPHQSMLQGVRLVGPASAIERVRRGEVTLYAVAVADDREYTPRSGEMVFGHDMRAPVQICPSVLGLRMVGHEGEGPTTVRITVDKP